MIIAIGLAVVGAAIAFAGVRARRTPEARPQSTRDGSPAWSPDGKRIAFYSERDGNAELYVMNADGSEQRRLTRTPADEGYPSWSPDGRTISFDTDRDGNFEIYAMDAGGGNERRLTSSPSSDVSASWSPDGSRIVFMSNRDGARQSEFDIYAMPASGGEVARLTRTGSSWFPTYAPDGATLAFHVGRDVHLMRTSGSDSLTRLTTDPANGMYPSWSRDGSRLAFMSWRNGRTEIFTMAADGSDQRMIVSMPAGDAIDPRFSPDGSRIVFVHVPGGMQNGTERSIWVVNADGTGLTRLTR
jgi:Tol biopolymer transport system component